MPLVTTVIPVYNAERYIAQTLESVARQTRRPDRLIILDNCSTDRTPQIVEEFRLKYPGLNCKWIPSETNVGINRNFNRALALAKETDCLHLLSADDLIEPCFFERLLPELDGFEGYGLAYSLLRFIDENGKLIPPLPKRGTTGVRRLSAKQFLINQAELRHVYCQSVVLKTDRQPPPVKLLDWQQAADVVFFAQWGALCKRITEVREPLCSYRVHTASGTGQNMRKLDAWVLEEWRAMRTVAELIPEGYLTAWLRKQKQKCIFAARSRVKMQLFEDNSPEYAAQIEQATKRISGQPHWALGSMAVHARDFWRRIRPEAAPTSA